MKKLLLLYFVLLILLIPIISAAPPARSIIASTGGIDISYPSSGFIKTNSDLYVRFWAYNKTAGELLTNTSINCTYNLLDSSGKNIIRMETYNQIKFGNLSGNGCANCFNFLISAPNITANGYYPYQIRCYGSGLGGYLSDVYEATATGNEFYLTTALMDIVVLILSFILFGLFIWAGIALPMKNNRDELSGYILSINNLKYVKMLCFAFAYLTFMLIMYFAWMIGYAYMNLPFLTNLFKFVFYTLVVCIFPLFIVGVFLVIANWVRDSKISEALSGGFRYKDD